MKKFSPKEIIKPTVVLLIIGIVAASVLALVNNVTAPIIKESDAEAELKSRQIVLETAKTFGEKTEDDGITFVPGYAEDGTLSGYVFTSSAKGYGGDVAVMTGVDAQGNVSGIQILSINETPGLGMNAKKDSWLSQFKGKSGELSVVKGSASQESEIQAITSATITSKAVTSAVNQALEKYAEINVNSNMEVSTNG